MKKLHECFSLMEMEVAMVAKVTGPGMMDKIFLNSMPFSGNILKGFKSWKRGQEARKR